MEPKTEKRVRLAATFIISAFVLLILYIFFTRAIGWILPFLFAVFLAYIIEPVVGFLEKKLHFKRIIASIVTIVITLVVLFSAISYVVYILVIQVISLAQQLPQFIESATGYFTEFTYQWDIFNAMLPDGVSQFMGTVLESVNQNLSGIVQPLTKITFDGARAFAGALPKILFFTVIFIIATVFISIDKMKIARFIMNQVSESTKERMYRVKDFMVNAFLKYVKALLIIIFVTFLELFIGFSIIRIENALLLALIICVVDILPIVGTGTVLVPWGVICLLIGDIRVGISLLVLYVIITIVRQFIEPKIVSVQIGLYPLVTIISMYIGFQLFGIAGMFYGPFFMIFIIFLHNAGIIRLYKEGREEQKQPKKIIQKES